MRAPRIPVAVLLPTLFSALLIPACKSGTEMGDRVGDMFSNSAKLYEGERRPRNEVAVIRCGTKQEAEPGPNGNPAVFHVVAVTPCSRGPNQHYHAWTVLPGSYTVTVECVVTGMYTGDFKTLPARVEAGKTYRVTGWIGEVDSRLGALAWRPEIRETDES